MAAEDHQVTGPERTQFRDLVAERKNALKLSYMKLAAKCLHPDTGEQTVKHAWLQRVVTGESVEAPDFDMLLGMSVGLEVDMDVLQDAASAQFFGSQKVFTESADARAFLEDADRLTPAQREAVQALMRSLAEGR
ncbi:hypothetical protein [Streptomyces sp. NPDC001422]|uniref:hypothetical protein n=1 Tax=Streptomyces sp. NPDC001422 TaxID=3364575 RepID=UPI0036970C69